MDRKEVDAASTIASREEVPEPLLTLGTSGDRRSTESYIAGNPHDFRLPQVRGVARRDGSLIATLRFVESLSVDIEDNLTYAVQGMSK